MKKGIVGFVALLACCLFVGATAAQAITPEDKCEAKKLKEAGKYGFCRLKAESKGVKRGESPDFSKCDEKYSLKWQKAETKAGLGVCPSEGDEVAIQAFIAQHTDDIATALAGEPLPNCPGDLASCQSDLTTCDGDLTTCTGDLGTCNGNLTTCNSDLGTCNSDLTTCNGDLATCSNDLDDCQNPPCGDNEAGSGEQCDGTDLDGATCETLGFAGGVLSCGDGCVFDTAGCWAARFVDNADGTITDNVSGLMWEKKDSDPGSTHYLGPCNSGPDWFRALEFAARLNGDWNGSGTDPGFAGYADWRVPTVGELQTLLLEPYPCSVTPCIDSIFGPTAGSDCAGFYWSSTSSVSLYALRVGFGPLNKNGGGNINGDCKTCTGAYVRAVRNAPH